MGGSATDRAPHVDHIPMKYLFVIIAMLASGLSHAYTTHCMGVYETLAAAMSACSGFAASRQQGMNCGAMYSSSLPSICVGSATNVGVGAQYTELNDGWHWVVASQCPEGQTFQDGSCHIACSAGTHEENGSCVPDPSNCQELAGQYAMIGGANAYMINGSSAGCTSGASFSGCAMSCTGGVSANGKASCTGCSFTGEAATGANAQPITSDDTSTQAQESQCLSQGKGFITMNGVTTCTSPSSDNPVASTNNTTSTTTNSSGTNTTITSTTSTNYGNGSTTSTTSTTTGTGGTSTTNTTGTGTGTGSGTSGNTQDIVVDLTEICDGHDDQMICTSVGTSPSAMDVTQSTVGVSDISIAPMGSSGSCPAPIALPLGMEFSLQALCDFATSIRPLFLAIAWLTAGMIVVGGFRQ